MDQENRCPQCGAALAADVPQGLCPACLLKRGLESQTGGGEASQPGSAAYVPPTPAELAPLFPDLEILELVGRGGMGVVYKARQKHLNRLVGLKILSPSVGKDPAFADRFAREAQAMAMLSHPHIVAVHDFGQAGGMYYFLMEFVDGLNLRRLLDTSKLAPQEALAIVPQICDALQYAHDKGVVHRDIKPENVLLDKDGQVKIADFGLAKLMGREAKDFTLTGAGQVMGTPNYMAPEQIEHPQDVDHRADIYSLGVVFYQMLTGELPIGRFALPSQKVQIDVRLDEVVLRALEKEPDLRYQQASEIKTRVESIVTSPFDAGDMQRAPPREPASERGDAASRDRTPPPAPGDYAAIEAAQLQVHAPAIGLLVVGILDLVAIPIVVFAMLAWHLSRTLPQPSDTLLLVPFGVLVFAFAEGSFVIFAARRMKRLESYGCAVAACFLAMLVTPANLLGLAIGIWALVVLSRAKVSAAFERQKKLNPARPTAAPSQRMLGTAAIVLCAVSFPLALLGGMWAFALAIFFTFQIIALILGLLGRRSLAGKTAALLTLIGISLFAVGVVPTSPPDISGNWQGEDWSQVTLTQTAPGQYTGTYTDTVGKEKEPGKIDLKWSRIERRFNGTWREGEGDRFGDLSVHLVGKEIQGALTTSARSKINPATPRLAEVIWTRGSTTAGAAANPSLSSPGPRGQNAHTAAETATGTGVAPVIERVTVDSDKAVIEGRASKNDKIVFIFGEKEVVSQTFPSPVHFKCTVEEGEVGDQRGPVARVTETDGKELPDMPAQILPVLEPVFTEPPTDAFTVVRGSLRFRASATRRQDGTAIVADCWANPDAPSYAQRMPFGVKLVPAVRKSEKDRTGAKVTGRVLTEPGGTGVAGARVGLYNRMGPIAWTQYAVTAADGTYTFDDVPPGESLMRNRNLAPDFYNYEAWIEAAPDRPPGVWSEAISVPVEQQDVRAHDLYVKYPQSISGTVRDADTGKPIAGAEIWFSSNEGGLARGGEGDPRALRLGPNKKVTDAQGRYRLYVRPREVTVSCDGTRDRYNQDDVHGQRQVVAEPQEETTVDFCCESGALLTGRVVNPDGTPAKDARVRVSVSWPVRVTNNGAGFGGGAARRGGRAGQGASANPDRLVPRTENWSVFFEARTDAEGRFDGYMRRPDLPNVAYNPNRAMSQRYMLQSALPVLIKARASLPDHSMGGGGQAETPFGEPLARPLVVTLEKTGAAVVRVLFQDGRPVPDAEIRIDGYYPGSDSRLVGQQGKPAEYLGDGRYRIAGLTAGLDYRLRAFRRTLPTRSKTGKLEIKPGQTTDAGELRLEWEEGLAGDAQPRFRLENRTQVTLAFSPDGATLASISTPGSVSDRDVDDVKLADVATGKVLEAGRIPANCMAFFPKSDSLALGCRDGTVVLTNQKKLSTWKSLSVSSSGAYPVAVSPNGAMIACGAGDGTVGCWDVLSGRKMHTLGAKGNEGPYTNYMAVIAFSPDNKLLVAMDQAGLCLAWDLESEKELGRFQSVHRDDRFPGAYIRPVSICFCPEGKTAAITFDGGEPLQFWDPRGRRPPLLVSLPDAIQPKLDSTSPKDGPVKGPGRTVLSPDCKMATTVLYSGWVAVWDIPSRRVFQLLPASTFGGTFGFRGLAFSPDGRLLATGNSQGVVEVWEIDAAARDAKKSESPAVALPEFLKTSEK